MLFMEDILGKRLNLNKCFWKQLIREWKNSLENYWRKI